MQVHAVAPAAVQASAAMPTCIQQVLGRDRLDRPPVTHRLDDKAASAATGDRQDASSPDPNALHRDPREGTGPRQLEIAPTVLGKALAVERPDHPPTAGGSEPPAPRPGAPPPLPQDTRRQAGPGRGRQDRRWLGASRHDLLGMPPHPRGRCRSTRPLGCSRPQGDHRHHQHRRHHQVRGQKHDPEPAVPRRLGYLHHGTPPLLRPLGTSMQPDLPNQHRANRRTQRPTAHTAASHLLCRLPGSSQPTTLRAYGPSGAILLAGGPGRSRVDTSR